MKTMRRRNTTRQPRDAGFTLIEIMLALGVLGVGMVMVATLFPAAIMQAKKSDQNTQATIIADNARTILTMRIKHSDAMSDLPTTPTDQDFVEVPMGNEEDGITRLLYDTDAWSPTLVREEFEDEVDEMYGSGVTEWPPNRKEHGTHYEDNQQGWIALVRRPGGATENDYQFVVIPYKEFSGVTTDYDWDDWIGDYSEWKYRDRRPQFSHFAANSRTLPPSSSKPYKAVRVKQIGSFCELWFHKDDHSDHFNEIAKGSPVLLDGRNSDDVRAVGRHPVIVSLREEEDEDDANEPSWVATLSGPLFDPDDLPSSANTGVSRGIWLVRGVSYGAPSPALGCTVFRTQLQP